MSATVAPWETAEWRAKMADPIGDVVHYKVPQISDEQADDLVEFILGMIVAFASKK